MPRRVTICALLVAFSLGIRELPAATLQTEGEPQETSQSDWLKDRQFFKPMLANIRASRFHMGLFFDEPVPFTTNAPGSDDSHTFWDVAFGGFFPVYGRSWGGDKQAPMETAGWAVFVDAAAHMLLDFDAASNDVINTDFRVGGGLVARLPGPMKNISLRYKFFHESTHIGDEFTLGGVEDPAFRRYNVSYEANELYVAVDKFRDVRRKLSVTYVRLYAGGRRLTKEPFFEDFRKPGDFDAALKQASRNEFQIGGELFLKYTDYKEMGVKGFSVEKTTRPQYFFIAADFYRRDRYDITSPEKVWATNLVAGLIYGEYFQGGRTVQLNARFYSGVNPHGQFRNSEIDTIAFDVGLGF